MAMVISLVIGHLSIVISHKVLDKSLMTNDQCLMTNLDDHSLCEPAIGPVVDIVREIQLRYFEGCDHQTFCIFAANLNGICTGVNEI